MDAQQAAERAYKQIKAIRLESGGFPVRDVEDAILAAFAPLLAAKDAELSSAAEKWENDNSLLNAIIDVDAEKYAELKSDRDRLASELARHHADAAETDASIRTSAKTVLSAEKVDGDRTCVPPLEEVVELLVAQVAGLRRDADRYALIQELLAHSEGALEEIPPVWSFRHIPGRHATFSEAIDSLAAQK